MMQEFIEEIGSECRFTFSFPERKRGLGLFVSALAIGGALGSADHMLSIASLDQIVFCVAVWSGILALWSP
jgi:hypothetical protein